MEEGIGLSLSLGTKGPDTLKSKEPDSTRLSSSWLPDERVFSGYSSACSDELAPRWTLDHTFGLAFYELVIGSKHCELILLILLKEARRLTNRLALAQG